MFEAWQPETDEGLQEWLRVQKIESGRMIITSLKNSISSISKKVGKGQIPRKGSYLEPSEYNKKFKALEEIPPRQTEDFNKLLAEYKKLYDSLT